MDKYQQIQPGQLDTHIIKPEYFLSQLKEAITAFGKLAEGIIEAEQWLKQIKNRMNKIT